MKYIYFYAWISMASFHKAFSILLMPMICLPVNLGLISLKKKKEWVRRYDDAFLKFPGGFTDWEAFGVMITIFLIPIIVFTVKYKIDIYTNSLYFIGISVAIVTFGYYWIYFKNIEWLKNIIQEKSKKFYT